MRCSVISLHCKSRQYVLGCPYKSCNVTNVDTCARTRQHDGNVLNGNCRAINETITCNDQRLLLHCTAAAATSRTAPTTHPSAVIMNMIQYRTYSVPPKQAPGTTGRNTFQHLVHSLRLCQDRDMASQTSSSCQPYFQTSHQHAVHAHASSSPSCPSPSLDHSSSSSDSSQSASQYSASTSTRLWCCAWQRFSMLTCSCS